MSAPQGSSEWLSARCGCATASRIADVVAKTKSGPSSSRANYLAELVAERLTGCPADRYTNDSMRWGTDREPEARALYAFVIGVEVEEVGFIRHPSIPDSGASPDGLIGSDEGLEIKCPGTAKHIATLLGEPVDGKYITQMMWSMACMPERKVWNFCSFDPRLPPAMQLFTLRVARDDEAIARLEAEVRAFLAEVAETVSRLNASYGEAA